MGDCCSFPGGKKVITTKDTRQTKERPSERPFGHSLLLISRGEVCGMLWLQINNMASVKEQLKPIILKSLRITDLTPADLRDDQPLLGGELEIDSIDILQLVLEIERHFRIKLAHANFDQKHLESVNVLAAIIESKIVESKIIEAKVAEAKT
jgi:acyl carrier protein